MYITITHKAAALEPKAHSVLWPGPRILIIEPDNFDIKQRLETATHYYLVVELAQAQASRFDMLRLVISRLARARVTLEGPFLFTDAILPADEVARLLAAAEADPWMVDFSTDPVDGVLSMLLLGENIVENPLFATFFANLNAEITEEQTGSIIGEIEKHLTWREGAEQA